MKTTTLLKTALSIVLVSTLNFSCKKKDKEEPFSDKLNVTMKWRNLFDGIDNTDGGNTITVPSASTLIFDINIGGENGLGKKTAASLEITSENSAGVKTTKFSDVNIAGFLKSEPVFENTKYTFTLKSTDGDEAKQGPFEVTVTNDSKIIALSTGLQAYSANYKTFISLSYKTQSTTHLYDCGFANFEPSTFNPKFIEFGLVKDATTNLYLCSATLFDSLGVMPEKSSFSSGYRKCSFQPYTGSIDFSGLVDFVNEHTVNNADLQSLTITSSAGKILVQNNAHFLFKTIEGKKGIGMFKNVVAGVSTEILLVYQR